METAFYRGKRVLVTGHTGFKGSWLVSALLEAGAEVTGYATKPPTEPNLFTMLGLDKEMQSIEGDVRDLDALRGAFLRARPEIVFHLAAQPIVRASYQNPLYTYETNVLGTLHALECVRTGDCVRSFLNVTTDKVYENREWAWGYRECDPLDGFDPYSNSKSCSELVTHSYKSSFFADGRVAISTARAGNVIGGGDFAPDRIVPDCIRAALAGEAILVRNPHSTRPYQHVLEPIAAYLRIARKQYEDASLAGWYNVGPDDCDCLTTGALVERFCRAWGAGASWTDGNAGGPHEANFLKLDCSKIKTALGWTPRWHIDTTIEKTVEWAKTWQSGADVAQCLRRQIAEYEEAGAEGNV